MEDFPLVYNSIEIGLWTAIGIGFLIAAVHHAGSIRMRCSLAAFVFFLFAASDAVELYTGAWWKPWWLFVWKTLCVVSLLGLYVDNIVSRSRRAKSRKSDSA